MPIIMNRHGVTPFICFSVLFDLTKNHHTRSLLHNKTTTTTNYLNGKIIILSIMDCSIKTFPEILARANKLATLCAMYNSSNTNGRECAGGVGVGHANVGGMKRA